MTYPLMVGVSPSELHERRRQAELCLTGVPVALLFRLRWARVWEPTLGPSGCRTLPISKERPERRIMPMSDDHKEALVRGRREGRVVKTYLQALRSRRPGRPVTSESVTARIAGLEERIKAETDELRRLELVQARIDAEEQLEALAETVDIGQIEGEFIEVAKDYSDRKGISYPAWREAGVPAPILKKAGIARTRRG